MEMTSTHGIIVLHESRVEPLIPARFGDFLEVRPGSKFDHKGSRGSRTGSENEILCKRVNDCPKIKSKLEFLKFCCHFQSFFHILAPIFHTFFNIRAKKGAKIKVFELQNSRKFIFVSIQCQIMYLMKVRGSFEVRSLKVRFVRGSIKVGFGPPEVR